MLIDEGDDGRFIRFSFDLFKCEIERKGRIARTKGGKEEQNPQEREKAPKIITDNNPDHIQSKEREVGRERENVHPSLAKNQRLSISEASVMFLHVELLLTRRKGLSKAILLVFRKETVGWHEMYMKESEHKATLRESCELLLLFKREAGCIERAS